MEPAAQQVTHIAKGAEDVEARSTDEISARLRSFDLRRHRTRERALTSGAIAACVITALLVVAAVYAGTHRAGPVTPGGAADDSTAGGVHLLAPPAHEHRAEAIRHEMERERAEQPQPRRALRIRT